LVHVQRDRERARYPIEAVSLHVEDGLPPTGRDRRLHPGFAAADIRQTIDLLG
jgi:hypothetical protein